MTLYEEELLWQHYCKSLNLTVQDDITQTQYEGFTAYVNKVNTYCQVMRINLSECFTPRHIQGLETYYKMKNDYNYFVECEDRLL